MQSFGPDEPQNFEIELEERSGNTGFEKVGEILSFPSNPETALLIRSRAFEEQGEYEEALKGYRELIRYTGLTPGVVFKISDLVFEKLGRGEEATDTSDELLILAHALLSGKEPDIFIEPSTELCNPVDFYLATLSVVPTHSSTHLKLAVEYKALGEEELANKHAGLYLKLRNELGREAFKRALSNIKKLGFRPDEALKEVKAYHDLADFALPDPLPVTDISKRNRLLHLVLEAEDQRNISSALSLYREGLKSETIPVSMLFNMANCYAAEGRYLPAIEFSLIAVTCDPEYAAPFNNLGNYYEEIDEHKKAEDAYQRALELDSECDYIYYNLGLLYSRRGNSFAARGAMANYIKYTSDPRESADFQKALLILAGEDA